MGRSFWCFLWKLATLKACVDRQPCGVLLHWDWENTLQQRTPSSLSITSHHPAANPLHRAPRQSLLCASFEHQPHNWVPKSHEITNVSRHIAYFSVKTTLTEFCWVSLIRHAFCQCAALRKKKKEKDSDLTWDRLRFNITSSFLIPNTSKVTYCKMIWYFFIKPSSLQIACGLKVISGHISNKCYKVSSQSK